MKSFKLYFEGLGYLDYDTMQQYSKTYNDPRLEDALNKKLYNDISPDSFLPGFDTGKQGRPFDWYADSNGHYFMAIAKRPGYYTHHDQRNNLKRGITTKDYIIYPPSNPPITGDFDTTNLPRAKNVKGSTTVECAGRIGKIGNDWVISFWPGLDEMAPVLKMTIEYLNRVVKFNPKMVIINSNDSGITNYWSKLQNVNFSGYYNTTDKDEQVKKDMRMQYHKETDPVKKKHLAAVLGIKPVMPIKKKQELSSESISNIVCLSSKKIA